MIMNAAVSQKLPSKASVEKFHRLRVHVSEPDAAAKLWDELTDEERERLSPKLHRLELLQRQAKNEGKTPKGQALWMWIELYGVPYQRAVMEVAARLRDLSDADLDWLLREGGELPRNPEDRRDILIDRGDLVILRNSREVFWQGERIDADWYRFEEVWEFFVIFCEHAQHGRAVDAFSFGGANSAGVVTRKKNRLKTQIPNFPKSLYGAFQGAGSGTQRFTIPAEQIHFFDE